MKIAPIPAMSSAPEAPNASAPNVRSLRMMTNATPGRIDIPPGPDGAAPLSKTDNNDQINATVEDTQPLSPQLAALAKQRRALQVKERELLEREKAFSAASTQGSTVDLARLKSEPLSVLLENGVTYDQLTQAILANQDGVSPKFQAMEAKIKALEEGLDKKLTDRDQLSENQALAEMQRQATQLLADDTYELVRETKSLPEVMRLIKETYHKTGEVLDVSEALNLVETELVNDSLKLARLKKVQSQLAPAQPVPPAQPQTRQIRTLTNRDTASVPLDRKQRALSAFHGTLKR